jgi:RNA methyltransferase, TrmH family
MEQITSLQNKIVKDIVRLQQQASFRKEKQVFCVEGIREITLAINAGFELDKLFINAVQVTTVELFQKIDIQKKVLVSKEVYEKIAVRENTENALAIFKIKENNLNNFIPKENGLYIVAETIEKPGNIGAMLRTADAANATAFIICNAKTDFYNPNTIRSSVGCVFTVPVFNCSNNEFYTWAQTHNIQMLGASLQTNNIIYNNNLTKSTAIVFGSEDKGLSDFWTNKIQLTKIPMFGKIDSLNVSNSCAIVTFEAIRQRQSEILNT